MTTSQAPASARTLRIGGASGFWGDSSVAAPQLVAAGVDVLVFDYLAETTMAILAAARAKKPELGYATDFVDVAMRSVLRDVSARGIQVIANAGGVNPRGCAAALEALAAELGVAVRVAVVEGDDLAGDLPASIDRGSLHVDVGTCGSGDVVPALRAGPSSAGTDGNVHGDRDGDPKDDAANGFADWLAGHGRLASANAYLGARPIAAALALGADIVVTGRCVDSALVLGPLLHAFGWRTDAPADLDRLAMGSLAGHLVECGCQATGGLFTDWQRVPDWPTIGYPIVECRADGSFELTKPAGSGGLVVREAVCEQLLYEIGDPAAYALPDVICDFTQVTIEDAGPDRVRVQGARGRPPGPRLKVSATAQRGFRAAGMLVVVGEEAVAKAERTGRAILERCRALLAAAGFADFTATHVEAIGAESSYGPHSRGRASREVVLRVVADHADRRAVDVFAREIAPAGTSWAPGTTGPGFGRPKPSPLIVPFSFAIDRQAVAASLTFDGRTIAVDDAPCRACAASGTPLRSAAAGAASADRTPTPAATIEEARGVLARAEPWVGSPAALDDAAGPLAAPGPTVRVRLIELAWARSGDKGDTSNVGIVARRREWLPLLLELLTVERVEAHLAHLVRGAVERHTLPGIAAINFVLHEALDGGGMASRRLDPLGKGMAQQLLALELDVPAGIGIASGPAAKPDARRESR